MNAKGFTVFKRRLVTFILTFFVVGLSAGLSAGSSQAQSAAQLDAGVPMQLAALIDDEKRPAKPLRVLPYEEPERSSWALAIDNDILALGGRDQDYTYGFNFTYTGRAAKNGWYSLDRPLSALDRTLGLDHLSPQGVNKHSIEVGMFGFTPEDIEFAAAQPEDRPYASLVYLASSRERLNLQRKVAWKTTLSIGALGLDLVGDFQNEAHAVLGGKNAQGWGNQISDGGELTARYSIARQRHLGTLFDNVEVKSTVQASVGYLTEASWSLSIRGGYYQTAWSNFNPELVSYGEKSSYTDSGLAVREHYYWGGISLKARAYNAFLQGQFRHSDVTYQSDELHSGLVEAWLGYTVAFSEGYRVSYVLRGHSSEIKQGVGDRNMVWGGLIFAKTFQ